ncbi:hypothetical protein WSK_0836 [Novosphingobium sp. Rr 2-17]|uniref:DUF2252 family protein n=1 Tax=Novosphingobium sp. Rr 2-17 TaxID=555793 RepID=UPI0002698843|nr:DUF2252 family protein [Novosphingobium sp. Rr 2-17]EIZ80557.1 hypothetical protein WSK_0836 [Novosphingobium sp. Rr 2-17]
MRSPSVADRPIILAETRALKMARSAHAYVRGNTANFYDWLAELPATARVPDGPPVWICGDCHLGNLGPIASAEGQIDIQIRDLDQAVIGNPAHDLVRLGLSLATAARGSDLPGVATARMIEEMVEGYAAAMRDPISGDPGSKPELVRSVQRKAWGRRWRHLARERLDDEAPTIPLGRKFWPLEKRERKALDALFEDPDVVRGLLSFDPEDDDRTVRMVDGAYWMKGCSSLGLLRYAVLIEIRKDKGSHTYALIDIKQAVEPIAPAAKGAQLPQDNAQRVLAAAQALSPNLGERMIPVRMMDRSLFIRELSPQDLKLEVSQFTEKQSAKVARYLAFVVGKAHARQMDYGTRELWGSQLRADRHESIDAPTWLWESVVALAGRHEMGYLEHCRRYALTAHDKSECLAAGGK